jgi:hypothetical protein
MCACSLMLSNFTQCLVLIAILALDEDGKLLVLDLLARLANVNFCDRFIVLRALVFVSIFMLVPEQHTSLCMS